MSFSIIVISVSFFVTFVNQTAARQLIPKKNSKEAQADSAYYEANFSFPFLTMQRIGQEALSRWVDTFAVLNPGYKAKDFEIISVKPCENYREGEFDLKECGGVHFYYKEWTNAFSTDTLKWEWKERYVTIQLFQASPPVLAEIKKVIKDGCPDGSSYSCTEFVGLLEGRKPLYEEVGWIAYVR
jgi:hypothetical protein